MDLPAQPNPDSVVPPTTDWFVADGEERKGPFAEEQLGALVATGALTPATLVWCAGMGPWARADATRIRALFEAPPPRPANLGAVEGTELAATDRVPDMPTVEQATPVQADAGSEPPVLAAIPPASDAMAAAAGSSAAPPVLVAEMPGRKRNYIAAHWAGDHSIGRSYWINVVLVSAGLNLTVMGIDAVEDWDLTIVSRFVFVLLVLSLPLTLWQWTGLLRSILRRRHDPKQGTSVGWGWAGLTLISFVVVVTIPTQRVPMIRAYGNIATGDSRFPPVQVRVLPGGSAVEISGGLPAGSAAKAIAVLEATPGAKVVHIDSTGGRIREAMRIARFVRQRGLNTYVSRHCVSAGTLIFVAGTERYMAREARVGFHAASFPGMSGRELRRLDAEPREFMRTAGIERTFLERALSTPPTTMWFPTVEELMAAKVITAVAKPGQFGMSGRQVDEMTPEQVNAALMKMPLYQAFRTYDPKGYAEMVEATVRVAAKGGSMENAIAACQEILAPAYLKAMPRASDEALGRVVGFWEMLMAKYGKTHPAILRAIFDNKPLPGRVNTLLPEYPAGAELEIMGAVFASAKAQPPAIDKTKGMSDLLLVVDRMEAASVGARERFINLANLGDREYVDTFGL